MLMILALAPSFPIGSIHGEIVSVDVCEWARTGTGVTPSGWTVTNIDEYADKSVRFDKLSDYVLSPVFPGVVTQLVMTVKSSSTDATRFLTAVPVVADVGARSIPAATTKSYEVQALVWRLDEAVRQFRLQNATGSGNVGWGIRSLDVYVDRGIDPPTDFREDMKYSDALSVSWTPDPRAVSNDFELCRITTIPPAYGLLRDWNFTSLTNASGSSKSFLGLNPPDELWDVEGAVIGLQKYDGGHLQIGNTQTGGVMRISLPMASGRKAVMDLLRSDKDKNFSAVIAVVGADGQTNESARIPLVPESVTSVVEIADGAKILLLISERGDNRIRVEDVKIVTDYVPGYATTNLHAECRTARNFRTVKGLESGDVIWRVRSFDQQGNSSVWSAYREVALSEEDPKRPVLGLAVIIR